MGCFSIIAFRQQKLAPDTVFPLLPSHILLQKDELEKKQSPRRRTEHRLPYPLFVRASGNKYRVFSGKNVVLCKPAKSFMYKTIK